MEESEVQTMYNRIKQVNKWLMNIETASMPLGLFSGRMGVSIYFYRQAHFYHEKQYHRVADHLLTSVVNRITDKTPIDFRDGLTGICMGIQYLIKNRFVTGNVNTILESPDEKIYQQIGSFFTSQPLTLMEARQMVIVLWYLSGRLNDFKTTSDNYSLYQDIIIRCINKIEGSSLSEKYTEPVIFSPFHYFLPLYLMLLNRLYRLNFYNYKIDKIWDEMHEKVMASYPYLASNRLFLALALKEANSCRKNNEWSTHVALLLQQIDISRIVESDFRNKNILPDNGLCGLYYILHQYGYLKENERLHFARKIAQSCLWDDLSQIDDTGASALPIGLIGGISGVVLAYQQCASFTNKNNTSHEN
jgi:hypothetical protein